MSMRYRLEAARALPINADQNLHLARSEQMPFTHRQCTRGRSTFARVLMEHAGMRWPEMTEVADAKAQQRRDRANKSPWHPAT
jgi:hypothetical protein